MEPLQSALDGLERAHRKTHTRSGYGRFVIAARGAGAPVGDGAFAGRPEDVPSEGTRGRPWRRAGARAVQPLQRPAVRRTAWVVVDQAVSSLTNFAAAVLVARAVSSRSFGAFSIALIVYMVVVGVVRALVSQPLSIRVTTQPDQRGEVAAATGAAILLGVVAGTAVAGAGLATGGVVGPPLVVTGVMLAALTLQDTWRFALFTMGRPARAVVNDLAWAGGLVLLILLVLTVTDGSAALLTGAWAGGAAIAAVLGIVQTRVVPAPRRALGYLGRHLSLGWRFTAEALLSTGALHITSLIIGAILGAASVGAIRGGSTLFGPLIVVILAVGTGGVAEGSRLLARAPGRVLPVLVVLTASLLVIAVAWAGILLAIPEDWGRTVLGATWPGSRDLIIPFLGVTAGNAVAAGALLGLRIVAAASATLRSAALSAFVTVAAGIVGASLWGAPGGVVGLALGAWIQAICAWMMLGRFRGDNPGAFSRSATGTDHTRSELVAEHGLGKREEPAPRGAARPQRGRRP